jgi:5-methylcytosine-specific restriction endonuclease McrA
MTMETAARTCPVCAGPIHGRSDKRQCSPECKREAKRAYDRDHHVKNRDHKIRVACEWQRANADRKQAYDAEYRERTRDRRLALKRDYGRRATAAQDPSLMLRNRLSSRARAARLRATSSVVTVRDIARLANRQRGLCAYCGDLMDAPEIEHVLPIVRGGQHSIGNIVLACRPCNRGKSHRTVMEWRTGKTVRRSLWIKP